MAQPYQLKAGDIMLYRPVKMTWRNFLTWPFGQLICIKTWHHISHVEVYDGDGFSWASRDGRGFDRYPSRVSELTYILRPTVTLDLNAARYWARQMIGTPYGWIDLLNFIGVPVDRHGIVCSPAATGYFRAGGWDIFPTDPINKIAPFQFLDLVEPGICDMVYGPMADF